MSDEPPLLTAVAAARYLRVSECTLRRHAAAGRIPCWVDNDTGRRRYPKAALDKWLESFAERKTA